MVRPEASEGFINAVNRVRRKCPIEFAPRCFRSKIVEWQNPGKLIERLQVFTANSQPSGAVAVSLPNVFPVHEPETAFFNFTRLTKRAGIVTTNRARGTITSTGADHKRRWERS